MNFGCYISFLLLNGCVCIVTSIHVCSNQTELGKTVYLSRDESDVTQCQCDVTSKKSDSRIGFHRQWFTGACDFNLFVTDDSIRQSYPCKDFEEKYFILRPGNALTISLEPNSDAALFDFNLAVHSYTDNTTLTLECYEQLLSLENPPEQTTSGSPISSSPADVEDTGLGIGAIVGIVIGVVLFIIIIIVIIVICLVKKRKEETYAKTRHDHDLHIYQSVTPVTPSSAQGAYDNMAMDRDGAPDLPMRTFSPTISDVHSNRLHHYDNQNSEIVIDTSAPKPDEPSTQSSQPSIAPSQNQQGVDDDYLPPSDMTSSTRSPDAADTAVNQQDEPPTPHDIGEDSAKYSKVTIIESSQI